MTKFKKGLFGLVIIGAGVLAASSGADSGGAGYDVYCDCVEEFNTLNVNSSKYQSCIDLAIAEGVADNPYRAFERKCNDRTKPVDDYIF